MASVKPTIVEVTPSVSATSTPTLMATSNINCSRDFRPRIGLRYGRKKGEERRIWKS